MRLTAHLDADSGRMVVRLIDVNDLPAARFGGAKRPLKDEQRPPKLVAADLQVSDPGLAPDLADRPPLGSARPRHHGWRRRRGGGCGASRGLPRSEASHPIARPHAEPLPRKRNVEAGGGSRCAVSPSSVESAPDSAQAALPRRSTPARNIDASPVPKEPARSPGRRWPGSGRCAIRPCRQGSRQASAPLVQGRSR